MRLGSQSENENWNENGSVSQNENGNGSENEIESENEMSVSVICVSTCGRSDPSFPHHIYMFVMHACICSIMDSVYVMMSCDKTFWSSSF